jgi:hypothetical protein
MAKGEIVFELFTLLNLLSAEDIKLFHLLPLFNIINNCNNQQRNILVNKGILKVMNQTLSNKDEIVLEQSINILMKIIYSFGELEGEGKPNTLKE